MTEKLPLHEWTTIDLARRFDQVVRDNIEEMRKLIERHDTHDEWREMNDES